jgi:hypothetical protein
MKISQLCVSKNVDEFHPIIVCRFLVCVSMHLWHLDEIVSYPFFLHSFPFHWVKGKMLLGESRLKLWKSLGHPLTEFFLNDF